MNDAIVSQVSQIVQAADREPRLFHENFLYIRPIGGGAPAKWTYNNAQTVLYSIYQEQRRLGKPVRIIVLKARKRGISTWVQGEFLRIASTHQGIGCKIVSHDKDSAKRILQMNMLFYDYLPPELQPMKKYRTKESMVFENPDEETVHFQPGLGSQITVMTAKNLSGSRSETNQLIHLSELAFYGEGAEEVYDSVLNTMAPIPGTVVIVESTANGEGGLFYDEWWRAVRQPYNRDRFIPVFIPWTVDNDCSLPLTQEDIEEMIETQTDTEKELIERYACNWNQLAWRRLVLETNCHGSEDIFSQENPICPEESFRSSGRSVFTKESLNYYSKRVKHGRFGVFAGPLEKAQFVESQIGPWEIWKTPQEGIDYFIGADPGQGIGKDFSTIQVLDQNFEQVAEYSDQNADPTVLVDELIKIGWYYNCAVINVELNMAYGILMNLKRQYPRIYRWEKYDDARTNRRTSSLFFETTSRTVHLLRERLLWAINSQTLGINSPMLLQEMKTFEFNPDTLSLKAKSGCHDDLVMALGIALVTMSQYNLGYRQSSKTGVTIPASMSRILTTPYSGGYSPQTVPGFDMADLL